MKLLKPSWVNHQHKPIFSIDIHPDESRFATGGQGEDSGKIVVWNFAPVKSHQDELSKTTPKILCEMTNHLGCVNCVRWAPNGKWLASGGDDALVMIWNIRQVGAVKSFGREVYEQWGCLYQLRGHDGDVLDLSWSLDGGLLASCSIDNSIIIWSATSLPDKVATIKGHTGLVKGISWDPVGKYLASQSDDRSLRVWRRSDWQEEANITSPFQNCGGTTQMLRLGWSPDGRYLVTAHALNNDGPVAKIVDRSEWSAGMDFVGHRKAVEVVSFNPRLFSSGNGNRGCLAIGSRDRSLSIWLTNLRRPLVVTHDLFENSILDISWSKNGYELVVCSLDGTVAFISFTPAELGSLLSQQKVDELFLDLYGCTSKVMTSGAPVLIEDPALLQLQDKPAPDVSNKSTPTTAVMNTASAFTSQSAKQPSINVSAQQESRTKDGRRRITPLMIAQPTKVTDRVPLPFGKSANDIAISASQSTPVSTTAVTTTTTQSSSTDHVSSTVTSTKGSPQLSSFAPLKPTTPTSNTPKTVTSSPKTVTSSPKTVACSPKKLPPAKRALASDDMSAGQKKPKKNKVAEVKTATVAKVTTPRKETSRQPSLLGGVAILKCPEIQPTLSLSFPAASPVIMELDNQVTIPNSVPILRCKHDDVLKWQTHIPNKGLLLAGNSHIACVACEDNSVAVMASTNGRRILAPFFIPSRPHLLTVTTSYLMIIMTTATVSVWDLRHTTNVIDHVPITPLTTGTTIVKAFVTDNGSPVVTLSNGTASCYNKEMRVWVGLCDTKEDTSHSSNLTGPLADIQRQVTTPPSLAFSSSAVTHQMINIAQLEQQILRSVLLNSPTELEHWVVSYARFLATHNNEHLLKALCYDLIGPTGSPSMFPTPGGQWSDSVVGVSKRSLLDKLLEVISSHVSLQRLYTELRETIDCV